jgi:hypothetical protein
MTQDEIIKLAGHRQVPPWVIKLVADAIAQHISKQALEQPEPETVACPYCKNSATLGAVYFDQNCVGCVKRMTSQPKREPMDWQPIETAPKDGNKIILYYRNRHNFGRTVMGCWVTDEQANETDTDGVGLEAGWYEQIDNWDDYAQIAIHEGEPTHWMPLPKPPAAHGIGGQE